MVSKLKKALKWIGIGLVVLIVIGVIAGSGDDSNSSNDNQTASSQSESKPTEEPEEVVAVDLEEFVGEFDENQLAAETKYEKKIVEMTGYVDNISEDIVGSYYVILQPNLEEFYTGTSVQCYFENKEDLVELKNGQKVTLRGKVDSQMMNVLVKKCEVVQ